MHRSHKVYIRLNYEPWPIADHQAFARRMEQSLHNLADDLPRNGLGILAMCYRLVNEVDNLLKVIEMTEGERDRAVASMQQQIRLQQEARRQKEIEYHG